MKRPVPRSASARRLRARDCYRHTGRERGFIRRLRCTLFRKPLPRRLSLHHSGCRAGRFRRARALRRRLASAAGGVMHLGSLACRLYEEPAAPTSVGLCHTVSGKLSYGRWMIRAHVKAGFSCRDLGTPGEMPHECLASARADAHSKWREFIAYSRK